MGSPEAACSGPASSALLQSTATERARARAGSAASVSPGPISENATEPDSRVTFRTASRFSVSVPVLSVKMIVVDPSVSTAANRSTSAFCRDMRSMPRASAMVATIGNPSGIAATARAITASIISRRSPPDAAPAMPITAHIARVTQIRCPASRSSWRSSGERSGFASATSAEIRPSSVFMPVATVTASPPPRVTAVPLYTIERTSAADVPGGSDSSDFHSGSDSPVSVDSSMARFETATSLRSAVTMSPPSSTTMSPGTSFWAGISTTRPSRRTRVVTVPSLRRASIERTARISVTKPMAALISSTAPIASASTMSR